MAEHDHEAARAVLLAEARASIAADPKRADGKFATIESRFGAGTVGAHELWDRIHVQACAWADHVASHPAALLDSEVYGLCRQIEELMSMAYQRAGVLLDGEAD